MPPVASNAPRFAQALTTFGGKLLTLRHNLKRALLAPILAVALGVTGMVGTAAPAVAGTSPESVAGDTPLATLTPGPRAGVTPKWRKYLERLDRVEEVWAHSPSMDRDIPLVVIHAEESAGPRPVIYLLNGADGGEDLANWVQQSDMLFYYLEKNINVVLPMAGEYSYYTDWVTENPNLGGKQMWETFLAKELPGPIEEYLNANGKRAIVGMSMSATSSILIPEHHPGFYDAAGSFSGCVQTSGLFGGLGVFITAARAGGTPWGIWGLPFSENRIYNDGLAQAEHLRGTALYVSAGSGFGGEKDMWSDPRIRGNTATVLVHLLDGGLIEGYINQCTHNFKSRLDSLGIPATFNFRDTGTHTWPYWQMDLRDSWPVIANAFGLEGEFDENALGKPGENQLSGDKLTTTDDSGSATSSGSSGSSIPYGMLGSSDNDGNTSSMSSDGSTNMSSGLSLS